MQLNHRHKFVSDQFGGHDAAGVQRIAQRDADKPGQRIKDVAEDLLEAETKQGSEQRVNGADQGDKADQHRQNNHRHFKAGQNIFPEHFKETLRFVQLLQLYFLLAARPRRVNHRQHDKGTEHIQDQRRDDIFGIQHGHIGADNRQ